MKETIDSTPTAERVPRGRSRSREPQETAYTAPAPRTVEEVSEYLFQLHPPLIYDPHRFSSGSRRSSPAARSRAGSRSAISKPSSRATSRATTPVPPTRASTPSVLHLECSMAPQSTQCHPEYSASPIASSPSALVKRPFGQVYGESSRPRPSPLHPPFVLSHDYGSLDNAPLHRPATPSSAVTVVELKATEIDSDDDFNDNDFRDASGRLNFRRSGSNERYSAQTKMGRIYRKVRLRRSKDQLRARQRLASNPERSLSGDGCLVPTHTAQRPPRYTRNVSPDESAMNSKPPSGSRPKMAKTYHTPPAIAEGDMAWSPNNSPT